MRKLTYLTLVLMVAAIPAALAIDPPPFGGGSPDAIPLDGGASYLLAAGAAYGYRYIKRRRAAKKGN